VFVVDGMNVIGSRPTGWWRDRPGAMRELVDKLGRLDEDVVVVLDGAPFEVEAPERVDVRFASRRGRDAADDDIAALVADHPHPAELYVVTSDADLVSRVERRGAKVEPAGRFARRLEELG
jgi:predicted RNA-binding protein with PIN domain